LHEGRAERAALDTARSAVLVHTITRSTTQQRSTHRLSTDHSQTAAVAHAIGGQPGGGWIQTAERGPAARSCRPCTALAVCAAGTTAAVRDHPATPLCTGEDARRHTATTLPTKRTAHLLRLLCIFSSASSHTNVSLQHQARSQPADSTSSKL